MSAPAFARELESIVCPETLSRLAEEVRLVEQELERQLDSQVELVRECGRHTLHAGGKRLRPALVSLSAEASGLPFEQSRAHKLAACMEMIHMATLIHDDVIDHASVRRGLQTAASKFGNTSSILTGDVLLAKAMAILAEDGDLAIIRNVSGAVVDLAEGEVHELQTRGKPDLSRDEHLEILRRKTATFIASCCQVGGLAARAGVSTTEALGNFGLAMGMAFQIADDLLDYASRPEVTGKPRWTDFGEGCATLPFILLWERLEPDERKAVEGAFGTQAEGEELTWLSKLMRERGALEESERIAQGFVKDALGALESLPQSSARDLLSSVADFVVWRKA